MTTILTNIYLISLFCCFIILLCTIFLVKNNSSLLISYGLTQEELTPIQQMSNLKLVFISLFISISPIFNTYITFLFIEYLISNE